MQNSVATRYAKGLYDAVTSNAGAQAHDAFLLHFKDLQKALTESRELKAILDNPAVSFEERRKLVRTIGEKSGWDGLFCNFVCLLIDRNRLSLINAIASAYTGLVDKAKGMIRLEITSARELGTIEVQKLVAAVTKRHDKKQVEVTTRVDPTLIGGAIAKLGEQVYDASIRSQLEKVRNTILQSV